MVIKNYIKVAFYYEFMWGRWQQKIEKFEIHLEKR